MAESYQPSAFKDAEPVPVDVIVVIIRDYFLYSMIMPLMIVTFSKNMFLQSNQSLLNIAVLPVI